MPADHAHTSPAAEIRRSSSMLDESMPRYFLDFTDTGELLGDHEGMELVDLEAARLWTCIR